MYRRFTVTTTLIKRNESTEGESIEQRIARALNNNEGITDGAPITYTERIDGVQPQYDIRTDRFELAVEAATQLDKANKAKREQNHGERTYDTMTPEAQKSFNEKYPNNKYAQKGGKTEG